MDKISNTYVTIEEFTDSIVGMIVDAQGDCTGLNICIACPFFSECVTNIRYKTRFLDKETRLKKAEDYLFNKILEKTLE